MAMAGLWDLTGEEKYKVGRRKTKEGLVLLDGSLLHDGYAGPLDRGGRERAGETGAPWYRPRLQVPPLLGATPAQPCRAHVCAQSPASVGPHGRAGFQLLSYLPQGWTRPGLEERCTKEVLVHLQGGKVCLPLVLWLPP